MSEAKKHIFSPTSSTFPMQSGQVVVSALPKDSFPVSPSVVHHINVSQTVEVEVQDEEKDSLLDGSFESAEKPKFSIFAPVPPGEMSPDDRSQ